jgi:DNA helicase-2/ATP-dependent DNA helicase PcrA
MSSQHEARIPTPEQIAILDSQARITVVRACPGAGKTEVFVESIRRKLEGWTEPRSGLAALSFTNIARETIEARVGGAIPAPHFVGTLDSFVFRFIVKPFAHLEGIPAGKVRLFPAVISDQLDEPAVVVGTELHERASLFSVNFSGAEGSSPTFSTRIADRHFHIPESKRKDVLEAKESFWKRTGIITHSDCHYLAARIVKHADYGKYVRGLLAKRFPVLCIDELQDTGFFLGRAFVNLFRTPEISGLLVGDPDQAIYGFGGASPTIFDDFEALPGAKPLPLNVSQRCPKVVCSIASALRASGVPVTPKDDAIDGKATLLVHAVDKARLSPAQARSIIDAVVGSSLAVITRKVAGARGLKGNDIRDDFRGSSSSGRRVNAAVQRMLNREPREAAKIIERELCRVAFGDEWIDLEALENYEVTKAQWRGATFDVLRVAMETVKGETWNDWLERVKHAVRRAATGLGWDAKKLPLRTYNKSNSKGNELRKGLIDVAVTSLWRPADVVTTIHKVKGAEFDTVVVFAKKPHKTQAPCPSKEWWSESDKNEEKRIAFVAVSRAKQHLILCVHTETHEALKTTQPAFLELFDEIVALPV